ncbi:MAG: DUF448 domain-containing protein [Rhodopila sp.]
MARRPNRLQPRRQATTEIDDQAALNAADEADPEAGPLRRCIVTRERLPKEKMIRFVVAPDGRLVADLAGKLPGRGMWLSASGDVLEAADEDESSGRLEQIAEGRGPHSARQERRRLGTADRQLMRAFARAARGPVAVPPDLGSLLQSALVQRIAELIGLARRAGQAVAGFEKAREYLRASSARLVLQACDGSPAERARFLTGAPAGVKVFDPLTGEALGRVFGRDYVVHVAVAPGKLADSLAIEAGRLAGLRSRSARTMGSERTTERATAPVNTDLGANGYT